MNHYAALELGENATEDEIRSAYRRLVKVYHPDVSGDPGSRTRFIEIQEAYEVLSDPDRKTQYDRRYSRRLSAEELRRREDVYRQWVSQQEQARRHREAWEARKREEEADHPVWRLIITRVNVVYNVLFIVFVLSIIAIPLWRYAEQQDLPEDQQRSFVFFAIPILAGLIFAGWSYYYWFILGNEEK